MFKTYFMCLCLLASGMLLTTSCDRGNRNNKSYSEKVDAFAANYLSDKIKIGEPKETVKREFGEPTTQRTSSNGEEYYYFFSQTNVLMLTNGFGGFSLCFSNNILKSWDPIYTR